MPPKKAGGAAAKPKAPAKPKYDVFPIREWTAREFCIQKEEKGGVWGNTLPTILILGKSFSGKTCSAIDICFELQDVFQCAVVFSGSEDGTPTFANMFPDIFIYSEVTAERLKAIIRRQLAMKKKYYGDKNFNPQLLVMFDDIIDAVISAMKEFQVLFKRGRHFYIMVIVVAHYILNAAEMSKTIRKKMYEAWFSSIKDEKYYNLLFDEFTDDYHMFVACTKTASTKPQDRVFWYKARHTDADFKFGSADYHLLGEMFYKPLKDEFADESDDDLAEDVAEEEEEVDDVADEVDLDEEGDAERAPSAAKHPRAVPPVAARAASRPVEGISRREGEPTLARRSGSSLIPPNKKTNGWNISNLLPENVEKAKAARAQQAEQAEAPLFHKIDRHGRVIMG